MSCFAGGGLVDLPHRSALFDKQSLDRGAHTDLSCFVVSRVETDSLLRIRMHPLAIGLASSASVPNACFAAKAYMPDRTSIRRPNCDSR